MPIKHWIMFRLRFLLHACYYLKLWFVYEYYVLSFLRTMVPLPNCFFSALSWYCNFVMQISEVRGNILKGDDKGRVMFGKLISTVIFFAVTHSKAIFPNAIYFKILLGI